MNWSNVKLILTREIRDQLRDRRTLFMIAVLPLLLYPLLGMSFFQIAQFMRVHATKVLVLGAPEIEQLSDLPPLVEKNKFSADLFSTPEEADLLELSFPRSEKELSQKQSEQQVDQAREALQAGDFQLVLYFPPDFGKRLENFRQRLAERREGATDQDPKEWEIPSPKIFYNTASEKSQIAHNRVARVLDHWSTQIGQQNLEKSNVPVVAARPFGYEKSDVAGKQHRDAAIWSKVLPFVLLIWALTGAFYPAIDLCAGEKERGTLETLLSSPAERSEIVWGKLLTIMIFSVATAALNLLSMGITGTFVVAQLNQLSLLTPGASMNLPPASAMVWLVAALLPVSALFSALCLALAAFARSTKEGQYYLMPLVLITMPLMILPMAPGVELTLGNSLIPVTGVVLLLRTMLEGNYMQGLLYVVPVAGVTIAGCLLSIRWAIDQFNSESVLFSESERFDLGLWIRHLVRDRGPTPTIAEAITCFVAILLIQFFMNLALPEVRIDVFADIAQRVFVSLVVFIAFPALLMTIILTRDPRRTLLLHKWPPLASVPVALLLAVAVHPLVHSMSFVVQKLYPMSDAMKAHGQVLGGLFENAPYAWLPFVLIAVLPALCEEVAFRGFILSGLRHIGHKWWAIGLSAIFFGVAHGVLQQSIMASMLGVLLGYIAVQTGSLLPCIAYHMAHNGLALLSTKLPEYFTPEAYEQFPQLALLVQREIGEGGVAEYSYGWPLVVAGSAIGGYLLTWLYKLPYAKSAEEQLHDALDHQNVGTMVGAGE